jgi:hypothetical protein
MKRINMNDMAWAVASHEAGKVEVNIAQIKEVLKIFLEELANNHDDEAVFELLSRYKSDKGE